jgi:hypothetical protein
LLEVYVGAMITRWLYAEVRVYHLVESHSGDSTFHLS